jgi:hypothetical protein
MKRQSRYVMRDYHGETLVFDTLVSEYINLPLFEKRMAEGREDWADHDFQMGPLLDGEDPDDHWRLCHATCRRCGEHRAGVWAGVDRRRLNLMWCTPTRWERFVRAVF